MASVAGKKRGPTKQWAKALENDNVTNNNESAHRREQFGTRSMKSLHQREKHLRPPAAAAFHAAVGGGRERWLWVSAPPTRVRPVRVATRGLPDWGNATTTGAGGGRAAVMPRQPTQQSSMQVLPLVPSGEVAGSFPVLLWQRTTPPDCATAWAATCVAPKLAMRPESAIA